MVKPFQSTRDSFQHTFVQFWRHRKIPLKGTYNFRDMGGYPTKEGQQIRWKTLYRSDHLHNLNTKALNTLSALELDTLVDFRTLAERKRLPDRLPHGHKIRLVNLPLGNPRNPNSNVEIEDQIRAGRMPSVDAETYLMNEYTRFANHHTYEFQEFFQALLLARGRPFLLHCTAGKDRTGFAAAIILRLLGVPDDIIFQDYLLTNQFTRWPLRFLSLYLRITRGTETTNYIRSLTEAKRKYLTAAFETIDSAFGSFDNYLYTGLRLSHHDINLLKTDLLENQTVNLE